MVLREILGKVANASCGQYEVKRCGFIHMRKQESSWRKQDKAIYERQFSTRIKLAMGNLK